jgi:putative ABC transport system permease protein
MIPLKYSIRSLRVRWATTLLTVVAIGVVVFASVLTFGMIEGIEHALSVSGDSTDLIIMREGSSDEMSSSVAPNSARELSNLPGIERDSEGTPLASREFVTILIRTRRSGGTANVIVRGMDTVGRLLRPKFKIVEGRDLVPGVNEMITSRTIAERFEALGINDTVQINSTKFTIVGLFEADGSTSESEVWADLRDLTAAQRFEGAVSIVNMRVTDETARRAIMDQVRENDQFKLKAMSETEYFDNQKSSASSIAIKAVAYLIATFLTIGAMFAAANTMYAAVSSRGREIGTLRAIGFPRRAILTSFLMESVILCMCGGVLGCLATLPINGLTGGTQSATFSEITFSFRFGPKILLQGMGLALFMGLLGGLFPALRAIRLYIVDALRQR